MKKGFIIESVVAELPQSVIDAVSDVENEAMYLSDSRPPVVVVHCSSEDYVVMTRDEYEAWFGVIDE